MRCTEQLAAASASVAPVRILARRPRRGLVRLLSHLARDPLGLLTALSREYGDFVRLRVWLSQVVLISHPDLVEEVLVTRQRDFRKNVGARRLESALGQGLLVSDGEHWLRQRRLMQPAFHTQRVEGLGHSMVSATAKALQSWRDGEERDVYQEMSAITLQIVGQTLFGTDLSGQLESIRRASLIMTAHLRSRLFSLRMLLPDSLPTPGNLRYAAAIRDLEWRIYRIIGQRRAALLAGAQHNDLLALLLSARDEHGLALSDRELRDEIFTIISAGYDTTALALTWAFVLLARHPDAADRMYSEIDAVLGAVPATATDVPDLHYVRGVVAETLRLYPSAWVIGREAVRDTWIGNQPVSRGTTVLLSPWILQRDRRFFDDPEAFRPDLWTDGLAQRLPRFAYAPFGGGQRTCLGRPFAQLELVLVLATIAQRYRLQLTHPTRPIDLSPVLTLQPRDRVTVTLTARRAQSDRPLN